MIGVMKLDAIVSQVAAKSLGNVPIWVTSQVAGNFVGRLAA